jgi:hypothetical protein
MTNDLFAGYISHMLTVPVGSLRRKGQQCDAEVYRCSAPGEYSGKLVKLRTRGIFVGGKKVADGIESYSFRNYQGHGRLRRN